MPPSKPSCNARSSTRCFSFRMGRPHPSACGQAAWDSRFPPCRGAQPAAPRWLSHATHSSAQLEHFPMSLSSHKLPWETFARPVLIETAFSFSKKHRHHHWVKRGLKRQQAVKTNTRVRLLRHNSYYLSYSTKQRTSFLTQSSEC